MDTWTEHTIDAYYRDPEIVWLDAGYGNGGGVNGGPIVASGHYVLMHCGRTECCRPEGPFATVEDARQWSRENLGTNAPRT